jgi:large subunit ribosomal protein L11
MATKKITKRIKLQVVGGQATPSGTTGPALGQAGVNIGDFITKFNAATQGQKGEKLGVKVVVYEDRSYDFTVSTPPATDLLLKAAGIEKGSGKPRTSKAGKVTKAQVRAIAERKMPDLNANSIEAAMKIIEGSARSAGIEVVE